jgi:hypothetical protein
MQYSPRHHQFGLCALVVFLLLGAATGNAQVAEDTRSVQCKAPSRRVKDSCCFGNLCLSPTSSEIAGEVCSRDDPNACVSNLIEKLGEMEKRCDVQNVQATQALVLGEEISEMVLTASLQVDGFIAEIDGEIVEIRPQGMLSRRARPRVA